MSKFNVLFFESDDFVSKKICLRCFVQKCGQWNDAILKKSKFSPGFLLRFIANKFICDTFLMLLPLS